MILHDIADISKMRKTTCCAFSSMILLPHIESIANYWHWRQPISMDTTTSMNTSTSQFSPSPTTVIDGNLSIMSNPANRWYSQWILPHNSVHRLNHFSRCHRTTSVSRLFNGFNNKRSIQLLIDTYGQEKFCYYLQWYIYILKYTQLQSSKNNWMSTRVLNLMTEFFTLSLC